MVCETASLQNRYIADGVQVGYTLWNETKPPLYIFRAPYLVVSPDDGE